MVEEESNKLIFWWKYVYFKREKESKQMDALESESISAWHW